MRAAFQDYMAGRPYGLVEDAARMAGLNGTFLDIGSATGRYSFALALAGADVQGVEIRPEQVEQARLIQSLDERLSRASVSFRHDPTSADDPSFLSGEEYDVVVSWGLLYHLANPVQHLRNLGRLAKRAAIVNTMTHQGEPGSWRLLLSDPNWVTKSIEGVGWQPHFLEVPRLLHAAGFDRVDIVFDPLTEELQRRWISSATSSRGRRAARLLVPPAVGRVAGTPARKRVLRLYAAAQRQYANASYFTYVAHCK
jgi:SAM-dependent methyltransferase